ncbi:GABA transporter 1 [Dendrobium catenatum]|uniref:GABA transporter 1 n=1 Tax=Dendrobium catenatum TaxID=906689 RepID=A0A2I0W806_9ASPA|nr:GABA transporter 1 [Dendrobium catenatum]
MASNPAPNGRTRREDLQNSIHGDLSEETSSEPLDAGALFVLKSKGSWLHCGYHLTTSIVAPALLSLPLAVAQLGWAAGVLILLVAGAVTFYSYTLLSLVLEQHALLGHRLLRFRDMAHHVLGPHWGRYYIGPLQFSLCFTAVVAGTLLAGQSMKVYLQPTNEVLEGLFADPKKEQYSARNVIPRMIFRSIVVAVGTIIAAMLPFFGDIIAVVGAFGFLPLDFVVPSVMYNITFRPSTKDFVFWINTMIATVSSILTVLGCIATVRQLTMDAKTYKLFANL